MNKFRHLLGSDWRQHTHAFAGLRPGARRVAILVLAALFGASLSGPGATLADSFGPFPQRWHDFFCIDGEVCRVGDFDGDGKDDILTFVRDSKGQEEEGYVYVSRSDGRQFGDAGAPWQTFFCLGGEVCDVGDFNGDGKDDIVAFIRNAKPAPQAGKVFVALKDPVDPEFGPGGIQWQPSFCLGDEVCGVGDFNGDGRDDAIVFLRDTQTNQNRGDVQVALSSGGSFGTATRWQDFFCVGNEVCGVGDFNGDGKDDIVAFVRDTASGDKQGDVYVALSSGTGFGAGVLWQDLFCLAEVCGVGDFNGDGKDDIVAFARGASEPRRGDVYVALSSGAGFGSGILWNGAFCDGDEVCGMGDFNGDGRDDAVAFVRDSKPGDLQGDVSVVLSIKPDYLPPEVYMPLVLR